MKVTETGVVLAVFSASVDVKLKETLRDELLRATKKNAPTKMRYELIYVRAEDGSCKTKYIDDKAGIDW